MRQAARPADRPTHGWNIVRCQSLSPMPFFVPMERPALPKPTNNTTSFNVIFDDGSEMQIAIANALLLRGDHVVPTIANDLRQAERLPRNPVRSYHRALGY
jgi:hypothetical protein